MKKAVQLSRMTILAFLSIPMLAQAENENTFDFPVGYGITASPAIQISSRHDDNIFLQDKVGVRSSWITELAPSFLLGAQQGVNHYTAKYTLKAGRYHSSRDDDYVDHLLELNTHNEFNYRNKLDLAFDYLRLHENRGSGLSDGTSSFSNTPDEYRDAMVKGAYTYGADTATGRIKVAASHLDREYTNHRDKTRGFDRKEDELGATFFYRVMPKTSLLFEAKFKDIDYDNEIIGIPSLDSDEATYQIGVTWDTTAKTTGTAQIGRTYKEFDSSQRKDTNFTSWQMGLEWAPRTYSVFNLTTSSSPVETNGTGDFIENTTVALSWQHAWSDRVSSKVQTSFTNEDYSADNRDDDVENYMVGMDYQFRRGVAFGINYTYETRDSNISGFDYTDNIFMLSAKIGM